MREKRVKVQVDLDADVIDNIKSLSKMFMADFDTMVNIILLNEIKKVKHEQGQD